MTFKHTPEQARTMLVAALRSGTYKQGTGSLKEMQHKDDGHGLTVRHCCLGVACEVFKELEGNGEWLSAYDFQVNDPLINEGRIRKSMSQLPTLTQEWLGFASQDGNLVTTITGQSFRRAGGSREFGNLVALNDDGDYTFAQIADLIEQNKVELS